MSTQLFEQFLKNKAYNIRVSSIKETTNAGSGHVTSALSAADIVAALFFYVMHYDPNDPKNPNNDRFILSKGHAAPVLYAVWKEVGLLTEEDLMGYRSFDSVLEGHPTPRFAWAEAATGSLGQGLSVGVGMALSGKMDKRDFYTYVLLGDSEVSEGSIWEALELGAYYKLDHLVGILDCNRLGQSTETMHGHEVQKYVDKCTAFGWKTFVVNGHNIHDIITTFDKIKTVSNQPTMIIAKTFKGYGVDRVEDKEGFHGKAFKKEDLEDILNIMRKRFERDSKEIKYDWSPTEPKKEKLKQHASVTIPESHYKIGDTLATRKAYGQALAVAGTVESTIISLDGEVKNSTFAQTFEEAFPDRFVQSFIAEQNMIGMAVGFAARNKIPFASTFACFLSRAFDQIRMAAIGRSPLRLVGSHAGVSIGQDGPSQMGLEDIALMRAVPGSVIFYPCDAVSTHKLVGIMVNRFDGITYLRTTRSDTPVIYENNEQFNIGGCKILKESDNDVACVLAAGITVFETLKAYEKLKKENISIAVIDLYCIKPLDYETLLRLARKSSNRIITIEDHYQEGGMGEAVGYALRNDGINITTLAVDKMPRSGLPEELMRYEGIDAEAIMKAVEC